MSPNRNRFAVQGVTPAADSSMRVAHILRKYNPAEWGGTETALERLFEGLHPAVTPIIYCPKLHQNGAGNNARDPLAEHGYRIKRFRACVPVWGISQPEKAQMISVGGNILSFDLIGALWREPVSIIHSHALGRLGGIALTVAKRRKLPFVVTIHGGYLDLPETLRCQMNNPGYGGIEWGKAFGALFNSHRVVVDADAILTCNEREAALLREKFPGKRIRVQPHGVPARIFEHDHRAAARAAFPQISGGVSSVEPQLILIVGRVDPVKNQRWVVERVPAILMKHPHAVIILAGACTDVEYGRELEIRIRELGLQQKVLMPGGFSPGDPRLIGLMQQAAVVVLPSISETFGLVILEAWAAGAPVISSRTSGASALMQHGENGWLFNLENPQEFHEALDQVLTNRQFAAAAAAKGRELARCTYDTTVLAGHVRDLYEELLREPRHREGIFKSRVTACAT
jgi:alpha-maltose-1-phosphate synthase